MNAWLPPSRIRLWAARLLAGLGALMVALPGLPGLARDPYPLRLGVDALGLWLLGKRRFRFAAAIWFGCSAFFHLVESVDHSRSPGWGLAGAVLLALATALLVWPVLRAPEERARVAPLTGVWALVATLLLTAVDAALMRWSSGLPRDAAFLAGASALALFGGSMLASQLGPLRWLGQIGVVALIGAAQTSELHSSGFGFGGGGGGGGLPAMDLAGLVTWLGLATFAMGLDWIRAGKDSLTRFARAGALSYGMSLLPIALAAFWAPVHFEVVAMAVARAAALGVAAGMMPRVAGRGVKVLRLAPVVGAPPLPLLLFVGAVASAGWLFLAHEGDFSAGAVLAAVPAALCLVFRTRFTRAALFLMGGLPVMAAAFGATKQLDTGIGAAGALAVAAVFGYCITGPAAGKHFQRRLRWAFVPAPRASLALAGVAVLVFAGQVVFATVTRPEARPGLVATAGGSVPLPLPLYFRPNVLRDAPSPGRLTGSAVAVDPLGRGTWVVDEERDEVSLVGADQQVKRFHVGEWPELLVVTREGRVFVSCREAARIDVIEPDFARQAIELDDEVRGLALDPSEQHLYAGLIATRTLASFDARTLAPGARLALDADPRSVAVTAAGVASLPDKGSAVELASADLRRHWSVGLPSGDGVAWHGQALLPAGRDLLVLHAQVNTGLERPVASGGYGGAVSQPVNLVATVLEEGRAPLTPPNARAMANVLDVPDVAGAALGNDALYLASRIKGQVERVPLRADGRLDGTERVTMASPAPEGRGLQDFEPKEPKPLAGNGLAGLALDGDRVITFAAFDRVLVSTSAGRQPRRDEVSLGAGRLDAQLALGRRLFFRNDRAISAAGLACASCHVDGREDGLVWRLQGARLQTPSLTGRVADTAPYNWHGSTRSLPDNITQTLARLGGSGLEKADREALARYLSEGLRPVRPAPEGNPALVSRGRQLFHDRTVGCASCHDPDSAFTDGQTHDVESLSQAEREELKQSLGKAPDGTAAAFDTPTLRQVGLTAPYFHDGSAKTLEQVVDQNRDRMGKTSQLSTDERRALVAYLRTL